MLNRRTLLKNTLFAGVALSGAAAFPGIRDALAQQGDYELVCRSDGVRVRSEPNLSGAILGSVSTGDVVWLTGASTEADGYVWIPITVQGQGNLAGYAAAMYFERPDGGDGWIRGTQIHVTSDNVNLRSGAGLGHGVIGSFNTNTNATVNDGPRSADGYTWYNISIGGMTGWMVDAWLAEGHTGGGENPGSDFPVGTNVRPTDALNLRSGPGTGNSVIGTYLPADVATVVGGPEASNGYTWYQVEMWNGGTVGWFAGEFLEIARTEPTGARHRVNDGPLNVRNNPTLGGSVVASIPEGGVFVVTDASFVQADGYTWMPMKLEANPSVTGWVAQGFSKEI